MSAANPEHKGAQKQEIQSSPLTSSTGMLVALVEYYQLLNAPLAVINSEKMKLYKIYWLADFKLWASTLRCR